MFIPYLTNRISLPTAQWINGNGSHMQPLQNALADSPDFRFCIICQWAKKLFRLHRLAGIGSLGGFVGCVHRLRVSGRDVIPPSRGFPLTAHGLRPCTPHNLARLVCPWYDFCMSLADPESPKLPFQNAPPTKIKFKKRSATCWMSSLSHLGAQLGANFMLLYCNINNIPCICNLRNIKLKIITRQILLRYT